MCIHNKELLWDCDECMYKEMMKHAVSVTSLNLKTGKIKKIK